MSIVDEIKQKIDIVEVIEKYTPLAKSGRTFRAPCPFHSEKKPSFFVYPEQQTWHCFGACNTGGDVFSFIMKKEGIGFGDALRLLAENTGVKIPSHTRSETEDRAAERLLQINQAATQYYHNLLLNSSGAEKARLYLRSRGLNGQAISDFQIGYSLLSWGALKNYLIERGYTEQELIAAGLLVQTEANGNTHDRFRDHIMFPIMDDRGRTTGFGARVLDDSTPKYINSPQTIVFDKSSSLFGINLAKSAIRQQDQAVFVEGYMDVILAHQFGFNNVIAPMGVAITEKQINQVKKLARVLIMALDPDEAGEIAMVRIGETLNFPSEESVAVRRKINPDIPTPPLNENNVNRFKIEGKRIINSSIINTEMKVAVLPSGKDPDEIIRDDTPKWVELVKDAVPIMSYILDTNAAKLDMSKIENRTILIEKMLPILLELADYSQQNYYLTRLAEITKTDYRKLELALSRAKPVNNLSRTRQIDLKQATKYIHSSPIEEYVLMLLLHHPELKASSADRPQLLAEYFENSENRVIFENWLNAADMVSVKESLDPLIWDHFDALSTKNLQDSQIEEKYLDCVLRLKEIYLRNMQKKQAEILAQEEENGNINSVMAKLQEQGTIINEELARIFNLRAKAR